MMQVSGDSPISTTATIKTQPNAVKAAIAFFVRRNARREAEDAGSATFSGLSDAICSLDTQGVRSPEHAQRKWDNTSLLTGVRPARLFQPHDPQGDLGA